MDSIGMYSAVLGFCVGAGLGMMFLAEKKYKKAGFAASIAVLSLIAAFVSVKMVL